MAEVYRGYQASLERFVAIKLLHPFLADDPEFKDRFEREARNVARLRHPNIVQVYDFEYDTTNESYYMVMELIDGQTLKDRLADLQTRGEAVPVREIIRIARGACAALAYAHARGMIHRDVKPANLMLDSDERIVLTDFGIAKIVTGIQFTASGGMVGTPAYMAPEQGLGEQGDERSDLYSLGVIMFQMCTGQLPYDAESPLAVILKHLNEPIPSIKKYNTDIPDALAALVYKAMAKDPDERFASAEEFLTALNHLEASLYPTDTPIAKLPPVVPTPPPPSPPAVPAAPAPRPSAAGIGGIVVLGLLVLAGFVFGGSKLLGTLNPTQTFTPTSTPTHVPTATPTFTLTHTPTATFSATATATASFTATATNSPTASFTNTTTNTATLTSTFTPSPSATFTLTATPSPSLTPSLTSTPTDNFTATFQAATLQIQNLTLTSIYATINAIALTQNANTTPTPNYTATALLCQPQYYVEQPKPPPEKDPIPADTDFKRTIVLRNNGDCSWLPGAYLAFHDGERFSAPIKIVMDDQQPIPPGGEAHFTFNGHTPKRGGTYTGNWEVRLYPDNKLLDPLLTISFFTYE